MLCPHCNQVHPQGVRFCPQTGQPIPQPAAGGTIPPAEAYRVLPNTVQPSIYKTFAWVVGVIGAVLMLIGLLMLLVDLSENTRSTTRGSRWTAEARRTEQYLASLPEAAPTQTLERAIEPTRRIEPTNTLQPTATARIIASPTPAWTFTPSATFTTAPTATPSKLNAGKIIFCYGSDNLREVYLLDPATRQTSPVTSNQWREEGPSFSADNSRVVYASFRSEGWELFIMDLRTKEERQLTRFNGQARFPEWSPVPGDERILFEGRADSGQSNIYVINSDGSDMRQLTTGNADSSPGWSPDGKMAVFGHARQETSGDGKVTASDAEDVYIVDIDSGETRAVTNTPGIDEILYAWSPDGEWIAISDVRADTDGNGFVNLDDAQGLYLIRTDGSGETALNVNNMRVFSPDWSPDGKKIVFTADVGSQTQIWIYHLDTRNLEQLTGSGPYYHTEWAK